MNNEMLMKVNIISSDMVSGEESIILKALHHYLKTEVFDLQAIAKRCEYLSFKGSPVRTFCCDGVPLIEIHPIRTDFNSNKITVSLDYKLLYKPT